MRKALRPQSKARKVVLSLQTYRLRLLGDYPHAIQSFGDNGRKFRAPLISSVNRNTRRRSNEAMQYRRQSEDTIRGPFERLGNATEKSKSGSFATRY